MRATILDYNVGMHYKPRWRPACFASSLRPIRNYYPITPDRLKIVLSETCLERLLKMSLNIYRWLLMQVTLVFFLIGNRMLAGCLIKLHGK